MKRPWWLCCGWRSGWCVLDVLAHWACGRRYVAARLPGSLGWICDRHTDAVNRDLERQYAEELSP